MASPRHLRILPVVCALALLAAPASGATRISRLWTGYKETADFVRLREILTGEEHTGDALVLRTQPAERDGFYFTLRLDGRDGAPVSDGRIVLHLVAPDAAQPRTFTFPFASDGRRRLRLELGLTGPDWTHGRTLPLAWRLEVFGQGGEPLDSRESFLWSAPATSDR